MTDHGAAAAAACAPYPNAIMPSEREVVRERARDESSAASASASGIPDPHRLADKRAPRSTLSNCDRDYDCEARSSRAPACSCLFGVIICFTSRQRQPVRVAAEKSSSSSARLRLRRRPARSATDSRATRTSARPTRIENVAPHRPRIRPPARSGKFRLASPARVPRQPASSLELTLARFPASQSVSQSVSQSGCSARVRARLQRTADMSSPTLSAQRPSAERTTAVARRAPAR
ncbi:hypothetical protein FKP32DRAFT_375822 [Trametes sanguinea]|nr:hypothetical protein FKP32DRAFT_375822 [Trametes sanguinea]